MKRFHYPKYQISNTKYRGVIVLSLLLMVGLFMIGSHQALAAPCPNTDPNCVLGQINPPPEINSLVKRGGAGGISFFLGLVVQLLYSFAGIAVVFMMIFGAFQFITSAGEKDAVSKARGRITYALIGLVLLAIAFLVLKILGGILNFQFFSLK